MYRRRGSGGISAIIVATLLGLVAGIGYLIVDNGLLAPQPVVDVVEPISLLPTPNILSTVPSISPIPAAVPLVQQEITQGARFLAPTAGVNSNIIESYLNGVSWDVSDLGTQVGHLQGTAWTQAPGNIVLAGHIEMTDGRAGVFARVDQMNIGDPLYLQQDGEERVYQVTQLFTTVPDDLSVLYPSENEKLTLITCSAYDFFADEYLERVIVIAERVS